MNTLRPVFSCALTVSSIAMAWTNIVYGFAGLRSDGEELRFAPRLPDRWKALSFSLACRGRLLRIRMERGRTGFRLVRGEPLSLRVYDQPRTLTQEEVWIPAP